MNTDVIKMSGVQQKAGRKERQLGVLGFLNDKTIQNIMLDRARISAYATNPLLTDGNQTNEAYRSLGMSGVTQKFRAIIEHGTLELFETYGVDAVTVITPGLELLPRDVLDDLGLRFLSLSVAIAEACARQELKHVGLIGTEWDTARDSALVTALHRHRIETYELSSLKVRQQLLTCVQMGILSGVEYDGKIFTAENFCLEVVRMLKEQEAELDGVVICNFELQSLASRLENMFPSLKVINAGQVFIKLMRDFILQNQ